MQKPEWEQKLPAGYRMATEADRGARIGEDWKMWKSVGWVPVYKAAGGPLRPYKEDLPLEDRWCHVPMCIPLQVGTSGTYPLLSQEAKDSMDQFHEAALEMLDRVVAVPQEDKELGYAGPDASLEDMESDCSSYSAAGTHVTIPVTHPWVPKPFTPNKYTRYIPTLDGRKVPVDVYCVLAAFPTGSAAVDHAVKKQLAPGQRGHKDRIQDLKEARDSLTRAIELEEAVQG